MTEVEVIVSGVVTLASLAVMAFVMWLALRD